MIKKITFDTGIQGKHLLVLGAIHGNEIVGPNAIFKVIDDIQTYKINLKQGKVTFVPICNFNAYKRDVRQIDENLNRMIKYCEKPITYEQKLANEICQLIKQSDVLLDLHSTHCEGDVPFVFCDYPTTDNLKMVNSLSVDYVLLGWPQIYSGCTDIADYSTEKCAHDYQKIGVTLECGYHKEPKAMNIAYEAIVNVLLHFGIIDGVLASLPPKTTIRLTEYIVKKKSGYLCQNYKHLDVVQKGQKLAKYDDGEILYAPKDGYILLPNADADIGAEWYYLGVRE
ncbi:MAG: succinylglutamate desuccinylase/aspartoacylase family protein [Alphaproteobacteria bacterium]|nr:succinylglutamate desuccinylase/aspartoacylase family protein [Alphaproteobacteria bacterium]